MDPTRRWIEQDKTHSWHPFTPMRGWCAPEHDPLVIVHGKGSILRDSLGREYLDGNSSIWTNLHGHNHPRINAAIERQLHAFAHVSFLGLTHPLAGELAARLTGFWPAGTLSRVFYSDDGSTAIEAALRMSAQYWQLTGQPRRRRVLAFDGAYHGDTLGAAGLGGIPLFHRRVQRHAGGDGGDVLRVAGIEALEALGGEEAGSIGAAAIEPLIQGAAGMRLWPPGTLQRLRAWCDRHGVHLIADEVMTGFGRTGTMFACEREEAVPDFLCLAKGLTGGYLPLAATLTRESVYEAFLGEYEERKTFYYGHSYTANALGCAAALASLDIFQSENVLTDLQEKIAFLGELMARVLGPLPHVGAVRQCGLIAGIDVVRNREDGSRFEPSEQIGARVCRAAREHGLLTRPIGDTVVLMPPYCFTSSQLEQAVQAIRLGVEQVVGN